jgi:hypothetical protein
MQRGDVVAEFTEFVDEREGESETSTEEGYGLTEGGFVGVHLVDLTCVGTKENPP